jgi:UDP-N-acetylmuramate dehydrogenase
VLHMASRGRRVLSDDGERVVVEAEAGEPCSCNGPWRRAIAGWRTSA